MRRVAPLIIIAGLSLVVAGCSSTPSSTSSTSSSTTEAHGSTGTATGGTGHGGNSGGHSTGATGGTGSAVGTQALSWNSCDSRFKCATLTVPVNYSDPSGATIGISVIELPATAAKPIGDIVFNPGGPGESGVQYLEQGWSTYPASLRAKFNLVSFDPRGVGGSDPLNCLTVPQIKAFLALNPVPTTPAQIQTVITATKAFVAGCEAHASTSYIASLSTENTARDMDRLRAALGQAKLTYYGYSYGTYLGTVYAELFPTHIRAMVLDGALDPRLGNDALEQQQAVGFEVDLHDFLAWCTKTSACKSELAGPPTSVFDNLMQRFENGLVIQANIPADLGGPQAVDYGVALVGVLTALYSSNTWSFLGQALGLALQGDGEGLALLADSYAGEQQDGTYQNIISADTATSCLDRPAPTTISQYEALSKTLTAVAPDFGGSEAWSTLACAYWPVPPIGTPGPAHVSGAPPILVIGSTNDPATPYQWAEALAKQIPQAVLLTRTGPGHTAYQFSSCVRGWADSYLETLALPPAGTVCASD